MSNRKAVFSIGKIIMLWSAIIAGYDQIGTAQQQISGPIALNYSQCTGITALDAAFDSRGTIHLLYANIDSGIYYQESSDRGQSWLHRQMLAPNLPAEYSENSIEFSLIKIISVRDTLYTFWNSQGHLFRRSSADGGIDWSSPLRIFTDEELGVFLLVVQNDIVYIVYNGRINDKPETYFRKSSDAGVTWSSPIVVAPCFYGNCQANNSTFAINRNYIHVIENTTRT
jgi:hypothetical protein